MVAYVPEQQSPVLVHGSEEKTCHVKKTSWTDRENTRSAGSPARGRLLVGRVPAS